MGRPQLSVVMGVHNGGAQLDATLDSILAQEGVDLEFIVVDDGSTDGTAEALARRAETDPRLRVLTQPRNLGLTEALIRGCAEARGEFIARQDCGDRSLDGRLARQVTYLERNERCVAVTTGARYLAPRGEPLFEIVLQENEWHQRMQHLDVRRIKGPPHHGATMFRREAYQAVGGYRSVFPVAQDIDLWLRLSEIGQLKSDAMIGYEAGVCVGSISAEARALQFRLAEYAIACARARRESGDDSAVDAPPVTQPRRKTGLAKILSTSGMNYFIGSSLLANDPAAARSYLLDALRLNPFHVRAWYKLTRSFL